MTSPTAARTRLSPDRRRTQLIDLGVSLLATRSLEELTLELLAREAGTSRGLLYHYFGTLADLRHAVVQRAVDGLVEATAPPEEGTALERLRASVTAYVDYVAANEKGYRSIVRGGRGSDERLRELSDRTREALAERFFEVSPELRLVPGTDRARMLVRGWLALTEEVTLQWVERPGCCSREELVDLVVGSLPPPALLSR